MSAQSQDRSPDAPNAAGPEAPREPVALPMDGVLDLHTFRPRDVADVVREYLAESGRQRVRRVRIVHGKGIGQLREIVHAVLRDHPDVETFRLAGSGQGGWGATLVDLRDRRKDLEGGGKD